MYGEYYNRGIIDRINSRSTVSSNGPAVGRDPAGGAKSNVGAVLNAMAPVQCNIRD